MSVELVAILVNAVVVLGGYVINSKTVEYRIGQLEKKVEKHNNVIQRTYILEEKVHQLERNS